jgi:hypothetical protein
MTPQEAQSMLSTPSDAVTNISAPTAPNTSMNAGYLLQSMPFT